MQCSNEMSNIIMIALQLVLSLLPFFFYYLIWLAW